jgi:hypothetical protein
MGDQMNANACSKCEELRTTISIGSAAELTNVLKVVRANVEDGTLVEAAYWPQGQIKVSRPSFMSIPVSGPWPDFVEYYFSCTACGQLYRLSVETYHGAGGQWSPWERR